MADLQWTYDYNHGNVPRDAVRYFVGDTDRSRPLVDDREIAYALALTGGQTKQAAAVVLQALATKFSREASFSAGGVSKSLSDVSSAYRARALELLEEANIRADVFFGGISLSRNRLDSLDTDAVPPRISFGLGDDREALQFDSAVDELRSVFATGP